MANIKLFPTIEEVFENPLDIYKTIFFPLLTVDLESIGKGNGKVHFVTVHGNGDPDIENQGNDFGYNFIKFKIAGNKYRFDGDINQIPQSQKAAKWYKEAELIYQEHKEKYLTKSEFTKAEDERREKIDFDYFYYIRGVINYWVTRDMYLETGKFIQGSCYTNGYKPYERDSYQNLGGVYDDEFKLEYLEEVLNELAIDFETLNFIGSLEGYNYSELGEGEIALFIDQDKNEVLHYFSWD